MSVRSKGGMQSLTEELERRRAAHLYRSRRVVDGPQRPRSAGRRVDAAELLQQRLSGPGRRPASDRGAGTRRAQLRRRRRRGAPDQRPQPAHHELEEALADFTGRERALLFSTGYMANLGVLQRPADRGDTVFEDRLESRLADRRRPAVRGPAAALSARRRRRHWSDGWQRPRPQAGCHRRRVQHGRRSGAAARTGRGLRATRRLADGRRRARPRRARPRGRGSVAGVRSERRRRCRS